MEISINRDNAAVVISIKGRMDAVTSPDFQRSLEDLVKQGERRLIVDCAALDYISSAGLRSILIISKALKEAQGRLALFGLNEMVREVFDISGFSSVIPIHETLDHALSGI
jgi:anti-sigma B factor antagonist